MPPRQPGVIATYYKLTKPGIVYGNAITAAAGFLLAFNHPFDPYLFASMLFGISLVMASACVFNNYIDRNIDKAMSRTKKRAFADRAISVSHALSFAGLLGLSGFGLLIIYTNLLAVAAAATGFFMYVVIYGISKRKTVYATEIGSVAGAMPIVTGYLSASGQVNSAVALLFAAMVLWQMPHFYAIALYRSKDYAAANLPVLPLVKGVSYTKRRMVIYLTAYILTLPLLTMAGHTGYIYMFTIIGFALYWLLQMLKGFSVENTEIWARYMFKLSLIVLLTFSFLISIDVVNRST